jgi:hypothetical protein
MIPAPNLVAALQVRLARDAAGRPRGPDRQVEPENYLTNLAQSVEQTS